MDDNTTKGELLYSEDELYKVVAKAHKDSLQLVIHAMGDKAIEMALDAVKKVLTETPREAHCYRIEHASVLST